MNERQKPTRVLLLGIGITAASALASLAESLDVVGVVRAGRPASGEEDEVAQAARELGIRVFGDVSAANVEWLISEFHPDCTVASSYDRILHARVLKLCPFINVHYAPLPKYRGRANVNWAIINGEDEVAITIHTMVPELDAGRILYQQRVSIGRDDTVADVYRTLNRIQRQVLAPTVLRHLGGYHGEPQDEDAATYGCARLPIDGHIDWTQSTERIYALVRALGGPYPLAYTYLGALRISVVRAAPRRDAPVYTGRIPGRVIGISGRHGYADVLTGDGVIRIHEVIAGSDPDKVPASSVIDSTRHTLGLLKEDLLARISSLESRLEELVRRGQP